MKIIVPTSKPENPYWEIKAPQWLGLHAIQKGDHFFFSVLQRCKFVRTNKVQTAAASIVAYKPVIYWNPEFLEQMTIDQQYEIFKHEARHFIFGQIGFADSGSYDSIFRTFFKKELTDKIDLSSFQRNLVNIAMDLAINSYADDCFKDVTVEVVNEKGEKEEKIAFLFPETGRFKDFPKYKTSLEYLQMLLLSDDYKGLADMMPQDLHEVPEDFEGEVFATLKKDGMQPGEGSGKSQDANDNFLTKEAMKDILSKALQHGSTSCPEQLRHLLQKYLGNAVDWKQVFRNFMNARIRSDSRSTVMRLNRKQPFVHPGRSYERLPKIAVAIDQSGSVSDELLTAAYAELNRLADRVSFTVVPFDCEVGEEHIFEWQKNQKKPATRVMHGGTDFQAPTDWVNKKDYDGLVVITDTYAPFPTKARCSRLWLTQKGIQNSSFFEAASQANEKILQVELGGSAVI